MKHILYFASLICFCFVFNITQAQTKKELEKKRNKLLSEISFTNRLLDETQTSKDASIYQLITLKKQISIREELIRTISSEISILSKQIEEKNEVILALEEDLQRLKNEYAEIMVASYRTRSSYNKLMFLVSASDFNSLYNRYKYLERYKEFRNTQVVLIKRTQEDLNEKLTELTSQKEIKIELHDKVTKQRERVRRELSEEKKMINSLQKKEDNIKNDLEKKKKEASQLKKAIADIIKKELEAARMNNAGIKLSGEFEKNKGKLPWPVSEGFITGTFGEHPHPIFDRVKTFNNGIDIKTSKSASVNAVFGGTIISVIYNPGFHKAILVKHGAYYTVYSNLDNVMVKPDQKIITGQKIGTVYYDESDNQSEVHIEIWKGTTILNPQLWLNKR